MRTFYRGLGCAHSMVFIHNVLFISKARLAVVVRLMSATAKAAGELAIDFQVPEHIPPIFIKIGPESKSWVKPPTLSVSPPELLAGQYINVSDNGLVSSSDLIPFPSALPSAVDQGDQPQFSHPMNELKTAKKSTSTASAAAGAATAATPMVTCEDPADDVDPDQGRFESDSNVLDYIGVGRKAPPPTPPRFVVVNGESAAKMADVLTVVAGYLQPSNSKPVRAAVVDKRDASPERGRSHEREPSRASLRRDRSRSSSRAQQPFVESSS
jgi:hypothetical protein